MFERGIRHRIETRYRKSTILSCLKTGPSLKAASLSLTLTDTSSAHAILVLGFIICLGIFGLEKLMNSLHCHL
jgi:hypothetical protein